jgi:hypothetical protein
MRARIFLSCGQRPGELECAQEIKSAIEGMKLEDDDAVGFECFLALRQQTLDGVREQIFDELRKSDYLVFVDFMREKVMNGRRSLGRRGSLWTNQELAIASFLDFGDQALLFQEKGVKKGDGILGALSGRAEPFSNRKKLPADICEAIKKRCAEKEWSARTRNRLELETWREFRSTPDGKGAFWWSCHVKVGNRHHRKPARNCYGYLDKVERCSAENGEDRWECISENWATAEYKWAGTELAGVRIAAGGHRLLDAIGFKTAKDREDADITDVRLSVAPTTDNYRYSEKIRTSGTYRLTFCVVSDTFPDATRSFLLTFGENAGSVSFKAELDSETLS